MSNEKHLTGKELEALMERWDEIRQLGGESKEKATALVDKIIEETNNE